MGVCGNIDFGANRALQSDVHYSAVRWVFGSLSIIYGVFLLASVIFRATLGLSLSNGRVLMRAIASPILSFSLFIFVRIVGMDRLRKSLALHLVVLCFAR